MKSGRDVDKFKKMHLTPLPGEKVKAPLLAESPVNLECRVKQTIRLGTHDMYLAEVAAVHADEAYLDKKGRFSLDAANPIAYSHGGYYQLGNQGSYLMPPVFPGRAQGGFPGQWWTGSAPAFAIGLPPGGQTKKAGQVRKVR